MHFIRYCATWFSVALLLITSTRADDDHPKRVPSGFTGVRGKKSIPDEAYNTSEDTENSNSIQQTNPSLTETPTSINYIMEKRAPSGFFGMRGKKPWNNPDEMYKRAPMGFVGMRGKKENFDEDDYTFDEQPKRAQMGFFGMRGKKYVIDPGYQGDKRAPMGFVGMRGKKDYETPSGYYEDNKRAPSGFFGMRGKKNSYGFFGMRGKKYPYEFRGKFVGVRGKKSSDISVPEDYLLESGKLGEDLDINQLMLLLTEQNQAYSSQ